LSINKRLLILSTLNWTLFLSGRYVPGLIKMVFSRPIKLAIRSALRCDFDYAQSGGYGLPPYGRHPLHPDPSPKYRG